MVNANAVSWALTLRVKQLDSTCSQNEPPTKDWSIARRALVGSRMAGFPANVYDAHLQASLPPALFLPRDGTNRARGKNSERRRHMGSVKVLKVSPQDTAPQHAAVSTATRV
jgi:hypothetical protein